MAYTSQPELSKMQALEKPNALMQLKEMNCSTLLSSSEQIFLEQKVKVMHFPKGLHLLREGQIAKNCYFVIEGCIREYSIINGEERTTEFFIKQDSLSDDLSKLENLPSNHNWECITDCKLSTMSKEDEDEMFRKFPRLETMCRIEGEKRFSAYRESVKRYLMATPEQRYAQIIATRPEILEFAPQYQIASYIGIKPESLSRIRSRMYLSAK